MACFRRLLSLAVAITVSVPVALCSNAFCQESDKPPSNDGAEKQKAEKSDAGTSEKKVRPHVSEDDQTSAMKFAGEHHPELARLLEQLKKSRPSEFARAVKELTQQIQQLERLREKNPSRYAAQLESWKQESQIRILMARWSRSKDMELEKQVRELLKKRREARLEQLQAERERLAEQQRRVDEQLMEAGDSLDAQVNREWEQLSRKAGAGKENGRKNAESPSATEDNRK